MCAACNALNIDKSAGNPIEKIKIVLTGHEGVMYIQDLPHDPPSGADSNNTPTTMIRMGPTVMGRGAAVLSATAELAGLRGSIHSVRQQLENLDACLGAVHILTEGVCSKLHMHVTRICGNVRHLMLQAPVWRISNSITNTSTNTPSNTNTIDDVGTATPVPPRPQPLMLSRNLPSLYTLWIEYWQGIGGRKAARLYTRQERGGKLKFTYYRRKIVWDLIEHYVRRGDTAAAVIDCIYARYGRGSSVTTIINEIRKDKMNNGGQMVTL